jgi:hypothetical protein
MTGTASGKLEFDAKVYLNDAELADAQVYVHLKGFARTTVTHLDFEHRELLA